MDKKTEENLKDAFAGESQAHLTYKAFAERAESEGRPNVARLFNAASFSEEIHAKGHLRALGGIGSTGENLQTAIAGETAEVEEMYPAYIAQAREVGEEGAVRSMDAALQAEKVHAGLCKKAKEAVDAGKDSDISDIFVCPVCGFTMEGEPPERCPICGTPRERFHKF